MAGDDKKPDPNATVPEGGPRPPAEARTEDNRVSPPERHYPEPKPELYRKAAAEPPTTGHSWDGIEEYDNPMPRWWLWTFYITIAWAVIYWILYPAWPLMSQATPGLLGHSTRGDVVREIEDFETRNESWFQRLNDTEVAALRDDPELERFAVQAGRAVFAAQCSQCHGAGAQGVQAGGFPSLLDDQWLWGGTLEDLHLTIRHGIRNEDDPEARWSEMPAFGRDGILDEAEIEQVVEYVLAMSGQGHDADLAALGAEVYEWNCAACHMDDGSGNTDLGAPALNNQIWLYGGDRDTLWETIWYSRYGVMPAFAQRLREAEIRAVAVYVHQLGGGQ
ncbi:MAG: cytochrome-c oxidase, cbb3-type subunit III [Alkalilacustris sp.]